MKLFSNPLSIIEVPPETVNDSYISFYLVDQNFYLLSF
jgi:hypothetical protein